MLSLHLSPKIARVSIAACILVAAAACNGDGVSGPPDFKLTPIVTFDDLKAALVEARNEANGGFGLDMWAAVVDRSGLVVSVVFTGETTRPLRSTTAAHMSRPNPPFASFRASTSAAFRSSNVTIGVSLKSGGPLTPSPLHAAAATRMHAAMLTRAILGERCRLSMGRPSED